MEKSTLYIFSDQITTRLVYVLDIVFKDRGISYKLINDAVEFEKVSALKWVYSDRPFESSYLTLSPVDLLFEEDIKTQNWSKKLWRGQEVLAFKNKTDVLASIFYVLTCYEEYLVKERDEHDRVKVKHSLLQQLGWLDKLMVERWSNCLINYLEEGLSASLGGKKLPNQLIPTFDIDNTFAYKLKTGYRKWMSIGRDLLKLDQDRLKQRSAVMKGIQTDPYDTFDKIISLKQTDLNPIVFWLLGDYGMFDRNISPNNLYHQRVIRKVAQSLEVGIHPSYQSNASLNQLQAEKKRLEKILGKPVVKSRQHFLKLKLPYSYEHLIKNGITDDYTLGFAEITGFRAGIARPFNWFNLRTNAITSLILHPFAYMDGTLHEYMHLTISEAKNNVEALIDEVLEFGGDFICIWHNETIGDYGKWKGWVEVLQHTLNYWKVKSNAS